MVGIDGLDAGDVVTAEQMRSLFGKGRHPLAGRLAELAGSPALPLVPAMGLTFSTGVVEITPFQREVAARFAAAKLAAGGLAEY
ncbi:hypothetical protein [Friedmanniella luteola]|uniref:hypothetical protein n=1 Tax=Friedmanniella luteola TaxID=546871 RepID=UPI000B85AA8D|nr:hypothetical protein [Friedmanniella luteola]